MAIVNDAIEVAEKSLTAVPLTVDGRSVGWRESDIAGWIEQRTKEAPQVMGERKRLRQAQAA